MPILIEKHCRHSAAPEDGTRILVMRYWPRGVKKEAFDTWARDLAPSPELLRWIMDRKDSASEEIWSTWAARYREEMALQSSAIADLNTRHKAGETITLLCGCHNKNRCHRSLLRELILDGEDK